MAFIKLNFNVDVNKCLSGLKATLRLGRPKSGIEKLEKEMARLRSKRDDIKNQINEAEREGKIPTNEVSQWLQEVEILEGKVADIEQDFQSMSCFSSNCFNRTDGTSSSRREDFATNLEDEENAPSQTQEAGDDVPMRESSNCCSIIRRTVKKLDEANELMIQLAKLGSPEPIVMLPISHRPPVGIESYVEDIVGYVDGGEGNIIGIYGMGGVGKTTILNRIQQHYNHSIFDCVIWIVASKDCQLKKLQIDIAKSLKLQTLEENDDEQTCGNKLFSYLKNRKCLLLLDDIWEHVDLQLLGMAHSATERGHQQPCKVVVFTTRSETVCAQMKAQKKIKVKCLDSDRAWQLFEQNSDGDVLNSDGGIKFVAKALAKECAGLPLALITVARAMLGKKSWEAWDGALRQIRDKHDWTTIGLSEDSLVMHKAFKLSYDSLEDDSIRECLLCCALWPEDYVFNKFEELIPFWISCGIIREFNVINEAFTKGCSHVEALMSASLLQQSIHTYHKDKIVKMHDVIRDMALLMVSGLEGNKRKWIVKARIGLSHLPRQEEWKEAEGASFMRNKITSLPEYGASTFPKLSMLILRHNFNLTTIPPSLFTSMPRLTYLDLCYCGVRKLPVEIGSLTELQYLNLSDNPITRLPAEFGCLGKLEYLLLKGTEIKPKPNGIISNLSMLKWLDIRGGFRSKLYWWLNELKCFKGRHQLSVAIDIDATTDYIEQLNMLPNVSIWHLALHGIGTSQLPNYDLGTPRWSCNVSDNLELLSIRFVKVEKLMLAAGLDRESSFGCLKILEFTELQLLENISLDEVVLRNLRELYIHRCPMLEDVSWVLLPPCLYLLDIRGCPKMKELISDVAGCSNSNSSIQKLSLFDMPNLNCISNRRLRFPYLEYIRVFGCPMLKKLPFSAKMLNSRLTEIQGDKTWLDNLEWEDEEQ